MVKIVLSLKTLEMVNDYDGSLNIESKQHMAPRLWTKQ